MKELTIKQKAEAYDKAIKELRDFYRDCDTVSLLIDVKEELANIFPEIKKSKDEIIRQRIIHALHGDVLEMSEIKEAIAWLEKQGKKSVDKLKVSNELYEHIRNTYTCIYNAFRPNTFTDMTNYLLTAARSAQSALDTIENQGKENPLKGTLGDVFDDLKFGLDPSPKQDEQKPADNVEPKFHKGDIIRHKEQGCTCKITAIDTATAEYRLSECSGTHLPFDFQDAWELVEQNPADKIEQIFDVEIPFGAKDSELEEVFYSIPNGFHAEIKDDKVVIKKGEQKSWSEEDEKTIDTIISFLKEFSSKDYIMRKHCINWLKSFKDRYTCKSSDEHYELEEFAKIVRCNLTGISKAVQKLFESKYIQLTGNKMYGGLKD